MNIYKFKYTWLFISIILLSGIFFISNTQNTIVFAASIETPQNVTDIDNEEKGDKNIENESIIEDENEDRDEDIENSSTKNEIVFKTFDINDIGYRRKYWREISLKSKANKGFFYRDKEFVKFIVEGVKNGSLKPPFKTEDKKERITKEEFIERLTFPAGTQNHENSDEDLWEEEDEKKEDEEKKIEKHEFFIRDISLLEIEEELLFHNRRSEWSFNILSLKLIIPKEKFETKIRREIGIFDFKELMEYLDTIPEALWRNDVNYIKYKKFSSAFKERLFTSILVKVQNPDNKNIAEMYGAKSEEEAIERSLEEEAKLQALMDSVWTP